MMTTIPSLKQSDILYVIYKYLQSIDGFEQTSTSFQNDLVKNHSLGGKVGWNGKASSYSLTDYCALHPNIAENQLINILQKSFVTTSSSSSVVAMGSNAIPTSLLRQMYGLYNPNDAGQSKRFVDLSSKLSETLDKLRGNRQIAQKASTRILYLEASLSQLRLINKDSAGSISSRHVDLTADSPSNYLTASNKFPHAGNDSSTAILQSDSIVYVLREVGQEKDLISLKAKLSAVGLHSKSLQDEISAITIDLDKLGCLTSGLTRGSIDSGLCLLASRELGIGYLGLHMGSSMGRIFSNSAMNMCNKVLNRYRISYTVSGHMLNPAYCAVFDASGRFILTGADDYLVKIWDVDSGVLVKTCRGHLGYITLIAISPDNSIFASACTLGSIRIWRLSDGVCLQVLKHKASVNWIKFDATSCALASASDDGQCIVWDLCKLLPEDASDVPIFDVIIEKRAKSRQMRAMSKSIAEPGSSSVIDLTNSVEVEAAAVDVDTSSSSRGADAVSYGLMDAAYLYCHSGYNNSNSIAYQAMLESEYHAPVRMFNSRGGIFQWSSGESLRGDNIPLEHDGGGIVTRPCSTMLILPHVLKDELKLYGGEEPQKVCCLDISPLGNVLVTGCEDGEARVWRFGDSGPHPARRANSSITSQLKLLRNMGASASDCAKQELISRLLLLRLEGHVSPISDIHFSRYGDRIVTGSSQDCDVRIWSLSKDYKQSTHIVLDLNDEEDITERNRPPLNRRRRRQCLKSQLYNVCWSLDCTRIVTVQSVLLSSSTNNNNNNNLPTRLKVWDSTNGDLLRVIWSISNISCRVLIKHPLNPSIFLTTGEDGYVHLWDIDREEKLCNVCIHNDDRTPSHLVDASFSCDGTRIAVTDNIGRLTVLGLDDPGRYSKVLSEQYFSTDYANIMHDAAGFAIDIGTQLPIHDAPIGPLMNLHGTPYDNQPSLRSGPKPLKKAEVIALLDNVEKDRVKAPMVLDRMFNMFENNKRKGRIPKKYRRNRPPPAQRTTKPSSSFPSEQRQSRVIYREFDIHNYRSSSDESSDSEFEVDTSPLINNRINRYSSRQSSSRQRSSAMHGGDDTAITQRRSYRSRTHIASYDDSEVDPSTSSFFRSFSSNNNTAPSRGTRAAQRAAKRTSAEIAAGSDEGTDSDDDSDSVQDTADLVDTSDEDQVGRVVVSSRKSSRVVGRPVVKQSTTTNDTSSRPVGRPIRLYKQRWYNAKHGMVIPVGLEVNRAWLQSDVRTEQYCPQVGDLVMYFPQGHIQWLQEFKETAAPPWNKFPGKFPLVECEVRDIRYSFPASEDEFYACHSVKATLVLVVTRIPTHSAITSNGYYKVALSSPRSTRNSSSSEITFEVVLRDWGLPDFLVPSDVFLRSIKLPWHMGLKVNVVFKEHSDENEGQHFVYRTYSAQVIRLINASSEWPQSPWDALEVRWDSDNSNAAAAAVGTDRIGPWEARPCFVDPSSSEYPSQRGIGTIEERSIHDAIYRLVHSELHSALFDDFMFHVDRELFPTYSSSIALPMCVDLILRRLKNGYYRQIESILRDINLIYENCANFNDEASDIVHRASVLREELSRVVYPVLSSASSNPSSSSSSSTAAAIAHMPSEKCDDAIYLPVGKRRRSQPHNSKEEEEEKGVVDDIGNNRSSRAHRTTAAASSSHHSNSDSPSPLRAVAGRRKRRKNDDDGDDDDDMKVMTSPLEERKGRMSNALHRDRDSGRGTSSRPMSILLKSIRRSARGGGGEGGTGRRTRKSVSYKERDDSCDDDDDDDEAVGNDDVSNDHRPRQRPATRHGSSSVIHRHVAVESSRSSRPSVRTRAGRGRRIHCDDDDDDEEEEEEGEKEDDDEEEEDNDDEEDGDEDEDEDDDEHHGGTRRYSTRRSSFRGSPVAPSKLRPPTIKMVSKAASMTHPKSIGGSTSITRPTRGMKQQQQSSPSNDYNRRATSRLNTTQPIEPPQYHQQRSSRRLESTTAVGADLRPIAPQPIAQPLEVHQRSSRRLGTMVVDDRKSIMLSDIQVNESYHRSNRRLESNRGTDRSSISLPPAQNMRSSSSSSSTSLSNQQPSGRRLDPDLKRRMLETVSYADDLDRDHQFFAEPVSEDAAPDYFNIISNPMDLQKIRSNVLTRKYESVQEVITDIMVMYENCLLYNDDTAVISKATRKQKTQFKHYCNRVLGIPTL